MHVRAVYTISRRHTMIITDFFGRQWKLIPPLLPLPWPFATWWYPHDEQ
jgi:hypothetical protein